MRRCRTPNAVLFLLLPACAGERPLPGASGDTTGVPVSTSTPAGRIALELWQLRPEVSLGEWFQQHATDDLVPGLPGDDDGHGVFGDWCVRTTLLDEVAATRIERTAYFYAPEPPDGLVLPESRSELVRSCRLGTISIRVGVADSATGAALADSVRVQLARAFGGQVSSVVSFFGTAYWHGVGRFRRGDVDAVSALQVPPRYDTTAARRPTVRALAVLPASGLSLDGVVRNDDPPLADSLPLDSTVALAGLGAAVAAPLVRVVRDTLWRERGDTAGRTAVRQGLPAAFRRWLGLAEELSPPERAAAFYVADLALHKALCGVLPCDQQGDSTALAPFAALGARFAWTELGAQWVYDRTWLNQARAFDRDGRLGQRILLAQMRAGFDFSGMCAAGPEGFRRVIANAERYLERVPNSPIAAEVHFLAGDAWADIVALAAGAGDIYADSSRYSADAPEARRRALTHYHAAIAANPTSPLARVAWRRAWWLLSELPPRRARFLCIYD